MNVSLQAMKTQNPKALLASTLLALAFTAPARAEQGGSAHYMPGATASFIDSFPGKPGGIGVVNYFVYYDASIGANRNLPLGGFLTAGLDATVYADTLGAFYEAPWNVFNGSLTFGVAVPYVWLEIEGQAQRIGPAGVPGPAFTARDTANGFGDITVYPFMLGWTNLVKDLKLDTRLGIYLPTGDYKVNQLANVGKNYWTFEPGIMASWLSSKIGTELSFYTGLDFNTANNDVDYQSGTSFHVDATVAQHLPLLGGFVGAGANGFYYKQITGDSGSGARLGDFEGMTTGVGPVVSYIRQMGRTQLAAEIKWLPELDVDKRMKGDSIWFKLALLF